MEGPTSMETPTIGPAIPMPKSVHLSLTIVYTVLYSFLFLVVYSQLWMILYYRHRRLSYQSIFLFLCLIWAGLRTTLFSFYYMNCTTANNLNTFLYWLLYCCPVCLQFITLCLMVVFFARVYLKSMPFGTEQKWSWPLYATVLMSALGFLANNVTCAVILKEYDLASKPIPFYIILIRVVISGTCFILMSVLLCVCILKMRKVSSTSVVLEAKGMTLKQSLIVSVLIIFLYTSRAIYNFIVISAPLSSIISFGYGWINVSDQADYENLDDDFAYMSFGIVLFVWEFLPTFLVVIFFRVHKPDDVSRALSRLPSESFFSRAYSFDNPRRYDSDEDISRYIGNQNILEAPGPYTINSIESSQSFMVNSDGVISRVSHTPPALSIVSDSLSRMTEDAMPTVHNTFYDGT